MELKLQLCVFLQLMQVSLAVLQHVTVEKGQTLTLNCPIVNSGKTYAEWKNPEGFVMFFNHRRVLRDVRYSIDKLSQSAFTISVSNVTFKDGGVYTCSQYTHPPVERKVEVTVLGRPRMTVTKHKGKTVIKCTAEGNQPPQIFWQIEDGPEILASNPQIHHEDKKYVSENQISVNPSEKRVAVKCLVYHPALHSQPLMDFVKIGRDSTKLRRTTTTTSSPTTQPQGSTRGTTTVSALLTTRGVKKPSTAVPPSETRTFTSTVDHVTATDSHLSTSNTSELSGSTTVMNNTISDETSSTGWVYVSKTTDGNQDNNTTAGNLTVSIKDPYIETKGSSSLLVFLVTCLIVCLLVVVIFFTIKLRRAHIIWKRENEESNPSEESSKSKSSQDDKNGQNQRRRGLFNTAFTQYVVEEPTTVTSVVNTGVMAAAVVNNAQSSQAPTLSQTPAKYNIKETEL